MASKEQTPSVFLFTVSYFPLLKTPPTLASMIHILSFSSNLSVYPSLFSFDGSSSSNHYINITFPWRLYTFSLGIQFMDSPTTNDF